MACNTHVYATNNLSVVHLDSLPFPIPGSWIFLFNWFGYPIKMDWMLL